MYITGCTAGRTADSSELRAIYAAAIDSLVLFDHASPCSARPGGPEVVLENATGEVAAADAEVAGDGRHPWHDVPRSLRQSFPTVSQLKQSLPEISGGAFRAILLAPGAIDSILHRPTRWAGWPEFYRRFPAACGLVRLSDVALDRSHTWAALYIWHSSDILGGSFEKCGNS